MNTVISRGLVALEDILEEIVGEFTTDPKASINPFYRDADGSYLVDGSTHVRDINRQMGTQLPLKGPRTLNGLIIEHLEMIPEAGTSLKIADIPLEIMQVKANGLKQCESNLKILMWLPKLNSH